MMLVYIHRGPLSAEDVQTLIYRSYRPLISGKYSMTWQGPGVGESKFMFSGAGYNIRVPYDGTKASLERLNKEWSEYCTGEGTYHVIEQEN